MLIRILLILTLFTSYSFATVAGCRAYDNFFQDSRRGWFYGELCEENKPDIPYTIIPTKVEIPWELLDRIDPDDIQAIETASRKIAIMYPDDFNLIEYKKLMSWMADKSTSYSRADMRVKTLFPDTVDFAANIPTNLWGKDIQRIQDDKLKDQTFLKYADKIGFIVFATETCPYCVEQRKAMDMFKSEYGYEYRYLYLSEAPETAAQFNVRTVPDIFMVGQRGGEVVWQRISTGLTSYADLKKSLLLGLMLFGEDIDESIIY